MKRKTLYICICIFIALCAILYLVVTPRKPCTYNSHPGQYLRDTHDCIYQEGYIPMLNTTPTSNNLSPLIESSFKCPEDYSTEQEKTQDLADFMGAYLKQYPDATVNQIQTSRYQFLVSHSCKQTLDNMLQHVDPVYSPMIRFMYKDFGPRMILFNDDTKAWIAYYPLIGEKLSNTGEELIFNFYLKDIYSTTTFSVQDVADAYAKNSKTDIVYRFSAPDPVTMKMAYFIYSDVNDLQYNYSDVYITKLSSIQSSVFAVTYHKRITGSGATLEDNVNNWFVQDAKRGVSMEIGNIGVNSSWIEYLMVKDQK